MRRNGDLTAYGAKSADHEFETSQGVKLTEADTSKTLNDKAYLLRVTITALLACGR